MLAEFKGRLSFTCVEMRDCEHPPEGRCSPQGLLQQVRGCVFVFVFVLCDCGMMCVCGWTSSMRVSVCVCACVSHNDTCVIEQTPIEHAKCVWRAAQMSHYN